MNVRKIMALLLAGGMTLGMATGMLLLSGCEDEGPMERAGERVDEAADEARERAEEAGEDVEEAAEDARDAAEDAVDDIND